MTSSASHSSAFAIEMPSARRTSAIMISCGSTSSGGVSAVATRWLLYSGRSDTRNCGRQSLPNSIATTRCAGLRSTSRRATKLRKPTTAFTSVPSGACTGGIAWYARYARLDASIRRVGRAVARLRARRRRQCVPDRGDEPVVLGRRADRDAQGLLVGRPHRHVTYEDALLEEARVHLGGLRVLEAEEYEVRRGRVHLDRLDRGQRLHDAPALGGAEAHARRDDRVVLGDLERNSERERGHVVGDLRGAVRVGELRVHDEHADAQARRREDLGERLRYD